jgi:tetratricopeptide (TPR) repeat protein
VERRFAVFAGADAQALSRRAPRARIAMAVALAAVLLAATRSADARPKRRDAKAAFDRGVVAYQKGDFPGASEALGKSFELEHDADTLYAWAQAERKLDHCDKAIELYQELLTFSLPAANKTAVEGKLAECRAIVVPAAPAAPPASEPGPGAARAAGVRPAPAREPGPGTARASGPAGTPPSPSAPVVASSAPGGSPPPEAPPVTPRTPYVFYKDPVALGLGGAGVVAAGIGVGFLVAAHSASNQAKSAMTYQLVLDANSKVDQRNKLGAGGLIAGGALVAGGVGWVLWKRHDAGEQRTVTGWLAPGGGGLVIAGPF